VSGVHGGESGRMEGTVWADGQGLRGLLELINKRIRE